MGTLLLLAGALACGQTDGTVPPPDRWPLMRELQGTYPGWLLDGNRLSISGWIEAGFTASTDAHDQLPMGFNYRANELNVQQAWLRFERSIVTSGTTEPTFGFRVDTFAGIDYRFSVARGLFDGQLTANQGEPASYGIDPVQIYGEAYLPTVGKGLDVKIGRWFCLFGIESIDTTQNALVSHSYTFIYNPFTQTGTVAALKLTDAWTVQAGLTTGSDVFLDPAAAPTITGGVKWAPPNGRNSVAAFAIVGPGRFDTAENFNNLDVFDLVYTHKFSDRLNYSLEALFAFQTGVPGLNTITEYGVVQYLSCQLAPHLNATGRLEFFDDVQGQRTGFPGLYTALTAGVTYKPLKSVLLRPELRYDYNGESRPFENHHGVFTAAFDAVIRY
ncbi:MAG: outer membrane beta-barrel protein [Gemmataceae bacterium]